MGMMNDVAVRCLTDVGNASQGKLQLMSTSGVGTGAGSTCEGRADSTNRESAEPIRQSWWCAGSYERNRYLGVKHLARGAFESVTAQLAELVLEDSGDVCTREERWPPGVLSVVAAAACNFGGVPL